MALGYGILSGSCGYSVVRTYKIFGTPSRDEIWLIHFLLFFECPRKYIGLLNVGMIRLSKLNEQVKNCTYKTGIYAGYAKTRTHARARAHTHTHIKFTLGQAMKAQRGTRRIALLFLNPRR